mmetsp:Transcript_18136/g.68580  ORF Transcript_18136/g.68580 Transcript_18136/m.68580 type:complete len:205 (+) Transcript_18136:4535-5149(+)
MLKPLLMTGGMKDTGAPARARAPLALALAGAPLARARRLSSTTSDVRGPTATCTKRFCPAPACSVQKSAEELRLGREAGTRWAGLASGSALPGQALPNSSWEGALPWMTQRTGMWPSRSAGGVPQKPAAVMPLSVVVEGVPSRITTEMGTNWGAAAGEDSSSGEPRSDTCTRRVAPSWARAAAPVAHSPASASHTQPPPTTGLR